MDYVCADSEFFFYLSRRVDAEVLQMKEEGGKGQQQQQKNARRKATERN